MFLKTISKSLYKKSRIISDSILNHLNEDDLNGSLKFKTKLKFKLSYSIDLPFSLGRTVRGFRFYNITKDPYSKVVFDLLKGKKKTYN